MSLVAARTPRLGERAIARGWITPEQLEVCLRLQKGVLHGFPLGRILVLRGLLTQEQLHELLGEEPPDTMRTGYVLMLDTVGYSKKSGVERKAVNYTFNRILKNSPAVKRHDCFTKSTGDGVLVVFFDKPEQLLTCAFGITFTLREFNAAVPAEAQVHIRTGLHLGPVGLTRFGEEIVDVHGPAVDSTERIMSLGEAGHILASREVYEALKDHQTYGCCFQYAGKYLVKHGQRLQVWNVHNAEFGNSVKPKPKGRWGRIALRSLAAALVVTLGFLGNNLWAGYWRSLAEEELFLAKQFLRLDDQANALERLTLAIEGDPSLPEPYLIRAGIYEERNDLERAVSDLRSYLSLGGAAVVEAQQRLAWLLTLLERYPEAIVIYNAVILAYDQRTDNTVIQIKVNQDQLVENLILRGEVLASLGNDTDALADFQRVVALDPGFVVVDNRTLLAQGTSAGGIWSVPVASGQPLTLARVPAGTFTSPAFEKPQWLPEFYIGVYEATVGEYEEFLAANSRRPPVSWDPGQPVLVEPVTCVSAYDALDFCQWKGSTLATKVEWYKAASGTAGGLYLWTDNYLPVGNTKDNPGVIEPLAKVGDFPRDQSPFGCFDMLGNVAEQVLCDSDPWRFAEAGHNSRSVVPNILVVDLIKSMRISGVPINIHSSETQGFRYAMPRISVRKRWGYTLLAGVACQALENLNQHVFQARASGRSIGATAMGNPDYGPVCWVLAPRGEDKGVVIGPGTLVFSFNLKKVPKQATLQIIHQTTSHPTAPKGGYAPVDIAVNGQPLKTSYDVAEAHGGLFSAFTDRWEIADLLKTGQNVITVQRTADPGTVYWIYKLEVLDESP